MTYVGELERLSAADLDMVGGKGANLGEMLQAGFPVPRGFCVTTEAYRQTLAQAGVWPQMTALLAAEAPLAKKAEKIQALVQRLPVPPEVERAIRTAYAALGAEVPVAVRSSATAEDLPQASFAGQQETFLGVRGAEAVVQHVRRCWASLWTERALAYREKQGFDHAAVALAVVVQEMIPAETAGVLFTVNPLNGQRGEMLVNAAYGLGESVVSGQVTPDVWRLSRSGRVLSAQVGSKQTRLDLTAEGRAQRRPVPPAEQARLCLSRRQLRQLAALGRRVQRHYGQPQDIEWAFAAGKLYLLQTRPITSLAPASRPLSRLEARILDDILEHYPDPPWPLDYQAVTSSYEQVQRALREAGFRAAPAEALIRLDADGLPYVQPQAPKPGWKALLLPWLAWKKLRLNPHTWQEEHGPRIQAQLEQMKRQDLAALSEAELADFIARGVTIAAEIGQLRFSRYIVPLMLRGPLLIALVRRLTGDKTLIEADLLGSLDYKTAEIDRALKELARQAAARPAVRELLLTLPPDQALAALPTTPAGREFWAQVQTFLAQHGARTAKVYLPFSNASWRERPADLLALLPLFLRTGTEAQASRFELLRAQALARLPRFLRPPFLRMLDWYRTGHVVREATLYAVEEAFGQARRGVHEAARRLREAGYLQTEDEVLYLRLDELYAALRGEQKRETLRRLIARRRQARPRAAARWQPRPQTSPAAGDALLHGQAGSPGLASGPVKVIHGPHEFHKLQAGDVLVCPFTDPTWTPLFGLAAAVVADRGGPLSHAAIVAREYGIPAVLGAQEATARLQDGMRVTVDGGQGVVRLQSSA